MRHRVAGFVAPMGEETWLPVVGFEGLYEVSDCGRVRSLDRTVYNKGSGYKNKLKGKVLVQTICGGRYLQVVLSKQGAETVHTVHRLVLRAFHGPNPDGCEGAHLDGVSTNNCHSNLKWVSPKENNAHKKSHGTNIEGESHYAAKITAEDAINIRHRRAAGEKLKSLAASYGMTAGGIHNVVSGKTWKHVPRLQNGFVIPVQAYILVLVVVAGLAAVGFYNHAIAKAERMEQERDAAIALAEQRETQIYTEREQIAVANAARLEAEQEIAEARAKAAELEGLFARHDIDDLLQKKPGLILRRANDGTGRLFDDLEAAAAD